MARIVINPTTFRNRKDALCVAFDEGFRIIMEHTAFSPVSEPTREQREFFSDTEYADDELQLRRTIIARVCTLDTSVPRPTDSQIQESVEFLHSVLEIGACQNEWEQRCVQKLVDLVEAIPVRTGGAKKPKSGKTNQEAGGGSAVNSPSSERERRIANAQDMDGPQLAKDARARAEEMMREPTSVNGRDFESRYFAQSDVLSRLDAAQRGALEAAGLPKEISGPILEKSSAGARSSLESAILKDARDEALKSKFDELSAQNRPKESSPLSFVFGDGQKRFDELAAASRPSGSQGTFESVAGSLRASPVRASQVAKQQGGKEGQSLMDRAKEAVSVAKDLADLVTDGAKDSVKIDMVAMSDLARPGRTGVAEIDKSIRDIPVMTQQGVVENGKLRPATDSDRRDVAEQNHRLDYDPKRGYVGQ